MGDGAALVALPYRPRRACQWRALCQFGPPGTIYDRFRQWVEDGALQKMWKVMLDAYDELVGIDVPAFRGAPFTGRRPEGASNGPLAGRPSQVREQDHLLVDKNRIPVTFAIWGGNEREVNAIEQPLLETVLVDDNDHPIPPRGLALNKGYDSTLARCDTRPRH